MKVLYLDCGSGASERALYHAMLELHADPKDFESRLHAAVILPETAAKNAATIYSLLGRTESAVQRYVMGICLMMQELAADKIIVSPVNIGWGKDFYANKLLVGLPVFTTENRSIHCTTPAAAVLSHYGQEFSSMPVMIMTAMGQGLDGEISVRAILGEML